MLLERSHQVVKEIFSHDIFKPINKEALFKKYNSTPAIYELIQKVQPHQEAWQQETLEIKSIPAAGILIYKEGHYTFSNDITWEALPNTAAITIQCSNVILDLNGFTLKVENKDITNNCMGISILNPNTVFLNPSKHKKVNQTEIVNGTLSGTSLYGICAQNVSDLLIENISVEKIKYENLTEANVSPGGFHINTAENITLTNCRVNDLKVTSSSCAGIQLIETENATLTNCTMSDFTNYDGSTQGYSYIGSKNCSSTGCKALHFASHYQGKTTTLGHTVIGFCPWFSSHLEFNDCESVGMTGCCDDCHGMSIFLNSNVVVNRFHAEAIIDGWGTNTGAKATGLEVYGIKVSIYDCTVENIKAIQPQDLQSAGYSAWGMAITFTNCQAKDVKVLAPNQEPNIQYGFGTGFGWAPDPREEFRIIPAIDVTYTNCKAIDCQVGFDTWFHINSTWEDNCSLENCDIPLLVQINGFRTISGNKCSECPKPFSVTLTNVAKGNTYPEM